MRLLVRLLLFPLLGPVLALPLQGAAPSLPADAKERLDSFGDPLPPDAVARLGTGRFRFPHSFEVAVDLSPDGKFFAASRSDGISLIDTKTGKEPRRLPAGAGRLTFSPNSKRLVWGTFDGTVRIWDVATAKERAKFVVREHRGGPVLLSGDAKVLVLSRRAWGGKSPFLPTTSRATSSPPSRP
jgi:hypothetical protein